MPEDEGLERRVRKPSIEHAETRWLALRLDDDVKEVREELREMRREQAARSDSIESRLQAHDGRFDSMDGQLRSLTQLVGQVLDRLPDRPQG